jgi:polysaccharide export outer membrane protein
MARVLVVAVLSLFGTCCCLAQDESLLIGPGDTISIQVLEASELTQHVRVTDSGSVPLVIGGQIHVAGLTPAQAADEVEKALKSGDYLLTPHATVTIDQFETQNVTVMGQVLKPSTYPINTPRPIMAVLAMAGGATDLADRRIVVERHGTREQVQYFLSNDSKTALDKSPLVYPGDTVVVPRIDVVYVLGDVARPGGYPMATNDGKLSMLQAIGLAGSRLPHGKSSQTRLIRKLATGGYTEEKVDVGKLELGKEPDITMQPDDIIYIPFGYIKNIATNLGGIVAAAASAVIIAKP